MLAAGWVRTRHKRTLQVAETIRICRAGVTACTTALYKRMSQSSDETTNAAEAIAAQTGRSIEQSGGVVQCPELVSRCC